MTSSSSAEMSNVSKDLDCSIGEEGLCFASSGASSFLMLLQAWYYAKTPIMNIFSTLLMAWMMGNSYVSFWEECSPD